MGCECRIHSRVQGLNVIKILKNISLITFYALQIFRDIDKEVENKYMDTKGERGGVRGTGRVGLTRTWKYV